MQTTSRQLLKPLVAFALPVPTAPPRFNFPTACLKSPAAPTLHVCTGPTCSQAPYHKTLSAALSALALSNLTVEKTGCLGECGAGPNVAITIPGRTSSVQKGVQSTRAACKLLHSVGIETHTGVERALTVQMEGEEKFFGGEVEEARVLFENAAELLGEWPELRAGALIRMASAWLKVGEGGRALECANEAVDLAPGLAGAWRRKGLAHEMCGQRELALAAARVFERLVTGREREDAQKWVKQLERRGFWPW